MKCHLFSLLCLISFFATQAQEKDSLANKQLPDITITAFEQQKSRLSVASSVVAVSMSTLDKGNRLSLVNGLNSIAGVRMEERSPGSYRLNIRGSSLRSPFGVRNIKIYWNDIPVTDAGGGTYVNQFAFNNIASIEIAKGPSGSLYGAGTGGLMILKSIDKQTKPGLQIDLAGGSFGMMNALASIKWGQEKNINQLSYAYSKNDGYRKHTFSERNNIAYSGLFTISDKQVIQASILLNQIYYETPGGLNANEFATNPRQERPAAGGFPSAGTARAAIDQTNFIAGISHSYRITEAFYNNTVLFGSFSRIKNPTFRNFERRIEPGFGARTVFNLEKKWDRVFLKWTTGAEWQQAFYNTQVSKNNAGNPDTLQTNDDIDLSTLSLFTQLSFEMDKNWLLTAGGSMTKSEVAISRLSSYPVRKQTRKYNNEFAPRITIVRKFGNSFSLSATYSKGFSPPTLAELLPSTGVISTSLQAEKANNYEIGARVNLFESLLQLDLTGFYFKLNDALVLRRDNSNADYFVNAGDVRQKGLEAGIQYLIKLNESAPLFSKIVFRSSHSLYEFKYGDYIKDNSRFSGKKLPGVPSYTGTLTAELQTKWGIDLTANLFHASSLFLNDANTVKDKPYSVAGLRLSYRKISIGKLAGLLYVGIDNLFDEVYSLGNDFNAAGGRYYNLAPARNLYAGIQFQCKR